MLSTFGSLNTSLQTLQTMQLAIQVSSHNVSNANTDGYSRQKAVLTPGQPYTVPSMNRYSPYGQVGTGVTVEKMQRFRDSFLDSQIRQESLSRDSWQVRQDVLQQAEVIWNEPSDTALNNQMSAFWTAWQDLAATPNEAATRANLVGAADDLAVTLNSTYQQFSDLRADLDTQVANHVGSINDLATQIAGLNKQIREVQGIGQQPNDLRDQRDKLLTELSGYINVDIHESESGTVMVSMGGKLLVMDEVASKLRVEDDTANSMLNRVVWDDTGQVVNITGVPLAGGLSSDAEELLGGKLGGVLVARDKLIPAEQSRLDSIANTLITQVNALHRNGVGLDGSTGLDFFSGTGASDIAVNSVISGDTNKLAAAADAASLPGDGSNALAIAQLATSKLMNSGTATINEYFQAGIAQLGQNAKQAGVMVENQDLLVQHLSDRQEALSGVSLDEETANLLQYQHTYEAASRVMTTVDEMLDVIINKMGLVGR